MFDICHPTYYHMSQLGCNDPVKLSTAFYVYMELCEVKRYWDVNYKYSETLQLFYLEAKKSKVSELNTFIPWPAFHNLTLDFISNILKELNKEKFTFVFKEGDTTSVYYSVSSDIVKPIAPEKTILQKQKIEKKFALEREINRNTANLYERALSLDDGKDIKHEQENISVERHHSALTSLETPDSELNNIDSGVVKTTEVTNFIPQNCESLDNINKFDNQSSEDTKCDRENCDIEQ